MEGLPRPAHNPINEPEQPAGPDLEGRLGLLAALQAGLTRTGFGVDSDGMQSFLLLQAAAILQVEDCSLVLLDDAYPGWMITRRLSQNSELTYQADALEGDGLVRTCLRQTRPILGNQSSSDPVFDPASDGLDGAPIRSLMCAPLVAGGKTIGAIKVVNKNSGTFDSWDRAVILMIAEMAASALYGTRLVQQLKVSNADLEAGRWELLGSRNTLRALFDNLPAALYIIDGDYRLLAINKSRTLRTSRSPNDLVGLPCYQALFDRQSVCEECRVHETLRHGLSTQRSERRYAGDDVFEWEINTHPIFDDNERVIQAILVEHDISDRRQLEAILTQSEKLAAIGQLAAGVAHEINNPLTAIIANAQILHRELPSNSDLQESVDLIARAGARATQVVRNLLDFARKEDYHLGLTDLNESVDRAIALVQHEIVARGVRLEFKPDPNLPLMLASQDHLQSVWLNLLLNAIDSLDKNPGEISILSRRQGGEVQVVILDNGKGIPADRLTRIFEPFYTTKAPGRGTGLGLSVSHRIVKQHGGRINVESQPGAGSKFIVVLPIS